MAREDDNKKVVSQFNDALTHCFRTGETAGMLELLAPDAVLDMAGMPPDIEGLLAVIPMFRAGLSDFRSELNDVIAEGDLVAYRLTWTARHTGELMGVPATGREISVTETHVERIREGKIVEHTGDWNRLGMLEQIGAVPAPGA